MAAKPKSREPRSAKATQPNQVEERIPFKLYERRGRLDGFALGDWLQAETEILGTEKKPKSKFVKRH